MRTLKEWTEWRKSLKGKNGFCIMSRKDKAIVAGLILQRISKILAHGINEEKDKPEDVFDVDDLEQWAVDNGFTRKL